YKFLYNLGAFFRRCRKHRLIFDFFAKLLFRILQIDDIFFDLLIQYSLFNYPKIYWSFRLERKRQVSYSIWLIGISVLQTGFVQPPTEAIRHQLVVVKGNIILFNLIGKEGQLLFRFRITLFLFLTLVF